jgi:hypothetical protein
MKFCGMTGKAYNLTKSYLENRHQRVNLKNTVSSWDIVRDGVLQGFVLGLLLFLIYVNNLRKITLNTNYNNNTKIVLYAGDCQYPKFD